MSTHISVSWYFPLCLLDFIRVVEFDGDFCSNLLDLISLLLVWICMFVLMFNEISFVTVK